MSALFAFIAAWSLRASVLFAIGLAARALAAKRSASLRHALVMASIVSALVVPLFAFIHVPQRANAPAESVTTATRVVHSVAVVRDTMIVAPRAVGFETIAVIVWACIAMLLMARTIVALHAASRIRRRATSRDGLLFSDEIECAAAIGIVRPAIVVSSRHAWSDDELRAVTAHEMRHCARRDPAQQLVVDVAVALQWFNPLVWIAARFAALERERACDDAVLDAGFDDAAYAHLLLQSAAAEGVVAMRSRGTNELESRLRSIVDVRQSRARIGGISMALIVCTSIAVSAALAGSGESVFIDDPLSERLPPAAVPATFTPAPDEAAFIAKLHQLARRTKSWEGDLVAERARWALAQARDGRVLAPLRASLDDRDWRVRAYAAWSLAIASDRGSVPRLVELMSDRVWRMRAMAAHALAASADARARTAMTDALRDPAWQVRYEAVSYLRHFPDAHPLVEKMKSDPHVAVRDAAEESPRNEE